MANVDSALDAARKVAAALNLPWSEVQAVYRALQDQNEEAISWLPKSQGRNVFKAKPEFVARLLIAIGFQGGATRAHSNVTLAQELTPSGRDKHLEEHPAAGILCPTEKEFCLILTDPETAKHIQEVEFQPDLERIIFRMKERGRERLFRLPGGNGSNRNVPIASRAIINGDIFRTLARTVMWSRDLNPVEDREDGDGDEA